ncbi:MAG: hypothetical protein Q8R65_07360 [Polynucleobacter sp.]|nr:hypothetical protein [Polynucleobacter sp.]
MTEVVGGFKSEVLTDGGVHQRARDREARKEQLRIEKEADQKRAAENNLQLQKIREENRIQAALRAEAKKAAELAAHTSKKENVEVEPPTEMNAVSSPTKQQHTKNKQEPLLRVHVPIKEMGDLAPIGAQEASKETEKPTLSLTQGAVQVPSSMPHNSSDKAEKAVLSEAAYKLDSLLPEPTELTVRQDPEAPPVVETGKRLIERLLSGASKVPENPETEDPTMEVKSKRGCERIQKIMHEKRDLEKQVEDLQVTVMSLQNEVRKYEIENKLVENVLHSKAKSKSSPELIIQAKTKMIEYLQSRADEIDHAAKVKCFNKYVTDPFYMQVFVQNNQPEDWQSTIEFIYDAIEMPESVIKNSRAAILHSDQPIRARTASLGLPLTNSDNPIDRITQHLGNMGI